jgi:hypothetical protein
MAAANVSLSAGIASSFSSVKKMSIPGSLQQAMAVEFKGAGKVRRSRMSRGQRVRVAGVRNAASELVEMEPALQGSQLLGDDLRTLSLHAVRVMFSHWCAKLIFATDMTTWLIAILTVLRILFHLSVLTWYYLCNRA